MQTLENTLFLYARQHLPTLPKIYMWTLDTTLVHHSFKWVIGHAWRLRRSNKAGFELQRPVSTQPTSSYSWASPENLTSR